MYRFIVQVCTVDRWYVDINIVQVLTSDAGEDAECHAAKLLEVVLIQYRGLVDQVMELHLYGTPTCTTCMILSFI